MQRGQGEFLTPHMEPPRRMEIPGGLLESGYHIDQEARGLRSEGSQLKPMVITVQNTSLSGLIIKCCPLGLGLA